MSLLQLLSGVGSAAAGYNMADDIRATGEQAAGQMGELAGQLQGDSAFTGYGVQTGLGNSTVGAGGSTNVGVGPDQAMMSAGQSMFGNSAGMYGNAAQLAQQGTSNPAYNQAMSAQQAAMQGLGGQQGAGLSASQQAMQNAMQSTAGREQDIYNRAMAMQQPGLDRAQAAQQAREFAMGRSGIGGSQFGGTQEDAAMARARAEASNTAAFNAMGQAQNEIMNQGQLAGQFGQLGQGAAGLQSNIGSAMGGLGAQQAQLAQSGGGLLANIAQGQGSLGLQGYGQSFTPLQQQLNALQIGGQNADRFQTGQLTGTGYGAQLGLGGIQAQINAEKAASELFGNVFGAGMNAIGSAGGSDGLFANIPLIGEYL